jgi:hypothetical protein
MVANRHSDKFTVDQNLRYSFPLSVIQLFLSRNEIKQKRMEIDLVPTLEKESENPGRGRLALERVSLLSICFLSGF